MMKRTKLILLAAILVGTLLLVLVFTSAQPPAVLVDAERPPEDIAARPTAPQVPPRPDAPLVGVDYLRTNAVLEQLSANNAALQAWGKTFMLKVANDHLSKVPLFGLKTPLQAEDVTIQTRLTTTGAEIALDTLDRKYGVYYSRGVVDKAVAWDVEMTGLFRDPGKFEHFGDNIGPWSASEARRAAEAMIKAKGLDIVRMGGKRTPFVRPDTFNLEMPDGSVRPVTVFYTVRWLDAEADDADIVEIRFRRTAAGDWQVTKWFQAPVGSTETESTDFASLYRRFFAGN